MRNLTIKRTKSFVGCLVKLKVYIEDPINHELDISGIPCRKLGEIKNGEEKRFNIDESKLKIFIIADKISRNYCNDCYEIQEGEQDVYLSGKNKLNLSTGNAFIFDNNESIESIINRKKNAKKGKPIFIAAILIGLIAGVALSLPLFEDTAKLKVFSDEGIAITLTDNFRQIEASNYTLCYDSSKVAVFALREEFSLAEGFSDLTLTEYANLVSNNNKDSGREVSELKTIDGLTYFQYDFVNQAEKSTYSYYTFIFKEENAFWLVQFATLKNNSIKQYSNIVEWAKSVKFE